MCSGARMQHARRHTSDAKDGFPFLTFGLLTLAESSFPFHLAQLQVSG